MYFSRVFAFVILTTIAATPWPAVAQSKPGMPATASQALAAVHQFIDGFNKGDLESALATCAPRASIVDEFPPHEWQGSSACADWARDLAATNKSAGITGGVVTLGTPWRIDVNGSRAYLVVPASYSYKVHGKPINETGSILTVALQRLGGVWRMTGWAWTAH
ncbi:MAG: hypothetical protein WB615_09015 [Candidatus Tumulicola sp.]